jgi:ribA/ribD-fused uncharacterized protein
MKIITLTLMIFSFNILANIGEDVDSIPHYKIYPKTPIVDYQETILDFYSVKDLYGEFSNFALFPIFMDGLLWPSSEHYYQAQKFFEPELKELIRNAKTPFLAAQMARDPKMPLRDDWDDVKDGIMLNVVRVKINSYQVLKELLKSTNQSSIYEHTKNDCYWADCLDRTGKNKLGKILEVVREEISAH